MSGAEPVDERLAKLRETWGGEPRTPEQFAWDFLADVAGERSGAFTVNLGVIAVAHAEILRLRADLAEALDYIAKTNDPSDSSPWAEQIMEKHGLPRPEW